jgi:hypothetical protein
MAFPRTLPTRRPVQVRPARPGHKTCQPQRPAGKR